MGMQTLLSPPRNGKRHHISVSRARLESIIANAIDILDHFDGDPDGEEDDAAGQYDEDYYTGRLPRGYGAGCTISDPGGCEHDGREEEYE